MVSTLINSYSSWMRQRNTDVNQEMDMSVELLLNSLEEMMRARRFIGCVLSPLTKTSDPYEEEWGACVTNGEVEIYANIFPPQCKVISISNVWNGCLIAFKARTNKDQAFSYSLLSLLPWDLASMGERAYNGTKLSDERIHRGIEPAMNLRSQIIPTYAFIVGHNSSRDQPHGDDETSPNCSSSSLEKAQLQQPMFKLSSGHMMRHIRLNSVGKKSTCEKMSVMSVESYEWLFASVGKTVETMDDQANEFTSSNSFPIRQGENIRVEFQQHMTEVCDNIANALLQDEFGKDDLSIEHLRWASHAARLMFNALTSFLRAIPTLRPCLPPSMTENHQIPLLLSICVHIALQPKMFGMTGWDLVPVNMKSSNLLRNELQERFGVINTNNDLPLDAIISSIIMSVHTKSATALPKMDDHKLHTLSPSVDIPNTVNLSKQLMCYLTECASIGFYIIKTFYNARCRVDKQSHNARNYLNQTLPIHENVSSVFDNAHAHMAEIMRMDIHTSAANIPPWPLSLIPESRFHRMIVYDLLQPANEYARTLLRGSDDEWVRHMSDENGLSMFADVLHRGWRATSVHDCKAVVISDRLQVKCVYCDNSFHSSQYAIPLEKLECKLCHVRICYNCFQSAGEANSMGFVCNRCTTHLSDLDVSSAYDSANDDDECTL